MSENNPSVLLVDDEPDIRGELAETVADAGFPYLTASAVGEARGLLADHPEIGIVVTDLLMPGESGLALLEGEPPPSSLERRREFVIMTGHGDKAEAIRALRLGVLDFLEKPFDPDALMHAIRRAAGLLRGRGQHRRLCETLREDMELQNDEITFLRDQLNHAYAEPLHCLSEASFHRDHETGSHTRRHWHLCSLLGACLGLDAARRGAHRVGGAFARRR